MIRGFPTVLLCAVLGAACNSPVDDQSAGGAGERPAAAESTPDSEQARLVAAYLAEPRFAEADLQRGELLSLSCVVCHTFGPGEDHLIGPNLNAVFGRPAAAAVGFQYSDALQGADIVWTPDLLDRWLAEPDGFLPGNNMPFAGLNSATDRNALLAYLLRATGESAH